MLSSDALGALLPPGGASASALPQFGEDGVRSAETDERAFREFESLLLAEVLKTGQRTSLAKDHTFSGGKAGQMYREMWMNAVAGEISDGGGIGVANALALAAARRENEGG